MSRGDVPRMNEESIDGFVESTKVKRESTKVKRESIKVKLETIDG